MTVQDSAVGHASRRARDSGTPGGVPHKPLPNRAQSFRHMIRASVQRLSTHIAAVIDYDLLRVFLGLTLLASAGFKGWELATDVTPEDATVPAGLH